MASGALRSRAASTRRLPRVEPNGDSLAGADLHAGEPAGDLDRVRAPRTTFRGHSGHRGADRLSAGEAKAIGCMTVEGVGGGICDGGAGSDFRRCPRTASLGSCGRGRRSRRARATAAPTSTASRPRSFGVAEDVGWHGGGGIRGVNTLDDGAAHENRGVPTGTGRPRFLTRPPRHRELAHVPSPRRRFGRHAG